MSMRLIQAMRDKAHMYQQCIIALDHDPHRAGRSEEIEAMVDFLEDERIRALSELKQLEDGTHEVFGVNSAANTYTDRPSIPMRTD